ncbi:MAG: hypothetical protein HFJ52_01660 [Clostridia bacterium]|nr:hypothetical protein [Clostridia bacterium]
MAILKCKEASAIPKLIIIYEFNSSRGIIHACTIQMIEIIKNIIAIIP